MKTFRVTWEIDIPADSPEAAARQALQIQRRPSTATVFIVQVHDAHGQPDPATKTTVDL